MKTKKEIQDWILKNCLDIHGDIDLTGLDFEGYDVFISNMRAENIIQRFHKAKTVHQENHRANVVKEGLHRYTNQVTLQVTPAQHEAIKKIMEE